MCFAPQRRALVWHFFDIWTSKSGPRPSVFNTFDLEMCFAPQRRALFRHLNFQKWSGAGVFCTFWLGNVLRATTACTFSTSQLPKVVRTPGVLYILTWKCASRHNGVHFFDIATSKSGPNPWCFVHFELEMCFAPQQRAIWHSHLARWLRTRRFSEPTFRPSGAHKSWEKHSVSRLSYLFAHLHLLSSYSFSSILLSSNLSLLSASSLLCFSSVHIVGSLTSKLPSIIYIYIYWLVVLTILNNISQIGSSSQLLGKIKFMFQTTNKICMVSPSNLTQSPNGKIGKHRNIWENIGEIHGNHL